MKWEISEGLTAALYAGGRPAGPALLRDREKKKNMRKITERPADVQDDTIVVTQCVKDNVAETTVTIRSNFKTRTQGKSRP